MATTTKSANFWFEDGNIILNVRTTQFRVHRGVLGRHAQVFRDMLSIPQPQVNLNPLMEGCPIITLDDDEKDWEKLLNVVYDCNTSCLSKETWELPMLTSVLRLGRKYAFDHLYDAALKRVKLAVPSSLETWDELFDDFFNGKAETSPSDDVIGLLNILLELDVRPCLPAAYNLCLEFLELEEIFRGTECDDGSIAKLSPASIETLILGKEKILNSPAFKAFPEAPIPSEQCLSRANCERSGVVSPYPDAARALEPWDDYDLHVKNYCEKCQKKLADHYRLHRQAIWSALPTYFGLESSESAMDV